MMMLRAAGLFLVVMGIIWVLQGAGLLDWPANSFMLGQSQWMRYGATLAGLGAGLIWLAGRLGRSRG
jgi:hypothetical protein